MLPVSWHLHVTLHGIRDILHLQLSIVHCFVQARKMRSAQASGPEGRDLRTDTKTLSSSLHPMISGGGGCTCCRWHCCQTAAWQLACLMGKESASFVRGRISCINYGLCDSWLTGPCWQCLTFAHCILQRKSLASQEDHLFSVILADPSTAEKHSSKIPCQGVKSHPVHSFWSWSLSMSEWPTVVWRGTCF